MNGEKNIGTQGIKLAGIVLALMLIVVGCTPGAVQPTPTPALTPTPLPTTPAPTVTLPAATLAAVPIVEESFPIGTYTCESALDKNTWKFYANGSFNQSAVLRREGSDVIVQEAGVYTVTENEITITVPPDSAMFCANKQETGSYTWSLNGQELRFKSLGDNCANREYILESCQWLMQP